MRDELAKILLNKYSHSPFIFLTADLGFNAFEKLRDLLKERFINVGISEQNMISVAAGLALKNENVWVYSIAPFCYARPFEQIRNDICYHKLPVKIVGNGGGYAYGAMGYTHHSIEDYGILLTLNKMNVYIPAFKKDIEYIVNKLMKTENPSYLRLGRCELETETTIRGRYQAWRQILKGFGPVLLVVGPLAGLYIGYFKNIPIELRPEIWVVTELPFTFNELPKDFIKSVISKGLWVAEEHVINGSVGQMLTHCFASNGLCLKKFKHFSAKGYLSGNMGSQKFHRSESGLTLESIKYEIKREFTCL